MYGIALVLCILVTPLIINGFRTLKADAHIQTILFIVSLSKIQFWVNTIACAVGAFVGTFCLLGKILSANNEVMLLSASAMVAVVVGYLVKSFGTDKYKFENVNKFIHFAFGVVDGLLLNKLIVYLLTVKAINVSSVGNITVMVFSILFMTMLSFEADTNSIGA